jgi:hypothetical protein
MHLLEKYSLNCGVSPKKLGNPYIYTSYFPIDVEKYIVIHASSGMPAKNYSYYQDVVDFIFEKINKLGYEIIQIGGADDPVLSKCINYQGKTNMHQSAFILKGASLLIANDSFSTHMASSFGIPSVSLYSVIQPEVAGPYWNNGKQFTIMAPLNGKKPKYSAQDPEMVINKIKPEEIIKKIQLALPEIDFSKESKVESLFFGKNYSKLVLEFVPDQLINIDKGKEIPLNIRFDYLKSDNITDENLHSALINIASRKCSIVTSLPFDFKKIRIEEVKQNVSSFIFHIEKKYVSKIDESIKFINEAIKIGLNPHVALIKDEFSDDEINELKYKFLDIRPINLLDQTSWSNSIDVETKNKITDLTIFKSSRIIYSNGKNYLSKAAYLQDVSSDSFEQNLSLIKDKGSLGKELENCYIYNP